MKLKDGFILRKVGAQYIVAATGEVSKTFHGMIRLDESGAFAFELLRNEITEDALLSALAEKYAVPEAALQADLARFLGKLKEADALV